MNFRQPDPSDFTLVLNLMTISSKGNDIIAVTEKVSSYYPEFARRVSKTEDEVRQSELWHSEHTVRWGKICMLSPVLIYEKASRLGE